MLKRFLNSGTALLAVSFLLPALLFGLAAWQSRRAAMREAEARVERTTRVLQEHAIKVFETHQLVIDRVNGLLRFMDWGSEVDRADLHAILRDLQQGLDQVATITVTDADGRLRASSRAVPADPTASFVDRDWFEMLRMADVKPAYVSRSYLGRQSDQPVFNVSERAVGPVPDAFDGVIAVSVHRAYFETFYADVEPTYEHAVSLVRDDGEIQARFPKTEVECVGPNASILRFGRQAPESAVLIRSTIDGAERLAAYRRIGSYPVFVTFAVGLHSVLAPWRRDLLAYGAVAVLAAAVLLAVSILAIRRAARERAATSRWRETAARLEQEIAERQQAEERSRQSQMMEAVGRLTGGVAHDFNNVLTVVIGSLDLLKRRLADGTAAQLRLIDSALDGANRAATLAHRLLAFSRQQPLVPVPIDGNKLVLGLSDHLRRMLGERYEIETVLAGGSVADARRPEPARERARQPRRERQGRHARRRQAGDRDRERSPRRGRCGEPGGRARGPVRAHRALRRGGRHAAGGRREGLRSLLHDEAGRQGDGTRTEPSLRLRQAIERPLRHLLGAGGTARP